MIEEGTPASEAPSLAAFAYHMQPIAKYRTNAHINVVTRQLNSAPTQISRERSPHGSRNVHSPANIYRTLPYARASSSGDAPFT